MKVLALSELLEELYDADGFLEFDEDAEDYDRDREEFAELLGELVAQAGNDWDAVREFLPFAVQETSEDFDWDTAKLRDKFNSSFRGYGPGVNEVIRSYFADYESDLAKLAQDRDLAPYFDWRGYIKKERPDLDLRPRGGFVYLFEGE